MSGLRILCIDNDSSILEGMAGLLAKWNCKVTTALSGEAAIAGLNIKSGKIHSRPTVALVDFHLDSETGLDVIKNLRAKLGDDLICVLVTADRSNELKKAAELVGVSVLNKPVRPAALRAMLSQIQVQKNAAE